ncbi:ParA family protein [Campylobacter jejuni]|nr:ParA family protein [Campylobacter jejuni]
MIISFSHPKGGVGKTTLCFNFLAYLQSQKKDFVCIDLDGQNSITSLNKIRKIKNLKPFEIVSFKDKLELINFINKSNKEYIIIDSGGFDSVFNRIVLSFSDKIVTPFSDSPLEIIRLRDFDEIISEIENQANTKININLVINRVSANIKNFDYLKKQVQDCKHYIFLNSIIRDRVSFKNSFYEGKAIQEMEIKNISDTNAKLEVENLNKEILGEI